MAGAQRIASGSGEPEIFGRTFQSGVAQKCHVNARSQTALP